MGRNIYVSKILNQVVARGRLVLFDFTPVRAKVIWVFDFLTEVRRRVHCRAVCPEETIISSKQRTCAISTSCFLDSASNLRPSSGSPSSVASGRAGAVPARPSEKKTNPKRTSALHCVRPPSLRFQTRPAPGMLPVIIFQVKVFYRWCCPFFLIGTLRFDSTAS